MRNVYRRQRESLQKHLHLSNSKYRNCSWLSFSMGKKGAYFSFESSNLDNILTMSYFIIQFNRGEILFEKKLEVFINEQHTLGSRVRHCVHKISSTCIPIKEESRLCNTCA